MIGIKETKIFRNTPEKPCNVTMIDYLNELSVGNDLGSSANNTKSQQTIFQDVSEYCL